MSAITSLGGNAPAFAARPVKPPAQRTYREAVQKTGSDTVQFEGLWRRRRPAESAAEQQDALEQTQTAALLVPSPEAAEALKQARTQMEGMIQALHRGDEARLAELFAEAGSPLGPGRIQQAQVPEESRLMVGKRTDGKLFFWLDLKDLDHPHLKGLSERYSFAPFDLEEEDSDPISVEKPVFDKDSVQLTAYCLGNIDETGHLPVELMHIYAGENFLITTHDHNSPTIEKKAGLLMQTQKQLTPPELVSSLLNDLIRRYGRKIDAFNPHFHNLQEKLSSQQTDQSIVAEFLKLDKGISQIYNTVLQQKRVLEEVIDINTFHDSEFIKNKDLELALERVSQLQSALHTARERHSSLVDLHRSNMSGKVEQSNKRLAALGTLVMPYMVMGGLVGMNVVIPGAGVPGMFWLLLGGATATSGGLFMAMRKKKWI